MSRGSNNKAGGAGNQSSQGFGQAVNRGKSNHGRQTTGGKPSLPERRKGDLSANRNTSMDKK